MKYSGENHNWDLTIMASSKLMDIGKGVNDLPPFVVPLTNRALHCL